jgi:hypothetical protein
MPDNRWSLILHGGARTIADDLKDANRLGCLTAARIGAELLGNGGNALDAVELVVCALENDPTFNAGNGSVPTRLGGVEMDAAIMDGTTLEIGAVAAIAHVRNPVVVARLLLHEPTVLLVGEGARAFARARGVAFNDTSSTTFADLQHDTVGCVRWIATGRSRSRRRPGDFQASPQVGWAMPRSRVAVSMLTIMPGVSPSQATARASCACYWRAALWTSCGDTRLQLLPARHWRISNGSGARPALSRSIAKGGSALLTIAIILRSQWRQAGCPTFWPVFTRAISKGLDSMVEASGPLIIIGGHEDKDGDRLILSEVAARVGDGKLVVATVASHQPEGYFEAYQEAFAALGVHNLVELYVSEREETRSVATREILADAAGLFFTGGTSCASQVRSATRLSRT